MDFAETHRNSTKINIQTLDDLKSLARLLETQLGVSSSVASIEVKVTDDLVLRNTTRRTFEVFDELLQQKGIRWRIVG